MNKYCHPPALKIWYGLSHPDIIYYLISGILSIVTQKTFDNNKRQRVNILTFTN